MSTDTATGSSRAPSLTNWTERLSEQGFAYLMLLPAFALVGMFALWPLAATFELSLHADALRSAAYHGDFVGFENYVALLTGELNAVLGSAFIDLNRPLQSALLVTLIYTAVSVTLELLFGFGQALVLDQTFRGRRWVRVAVIIPWAVPIAIQGLIFYLLFLPDVGFLTQPLQSLGVLSSTPFNNSGDLLLIVIVADVWKTSAFIALIVLAGLQSIDRELYRVAKVSGASVWQRFRHITFPLVVPVLLVALLFRTIQAMRVFGVIRTVGGGGGCQTMPSLSCMVVTTFNSGRYATAAAVAFVTALVVAVVASIYVFFFADLDRGGI
jgi:multiple sugar transport system permease protein